MFKNFYHFSVLILIFMIIPFDLYSQSNSVILTGQADSTDLAAISEIRREIEQSELTMDVEALQNLKRHFTDDVAMMPGNLVVRGSDNIITFHENMYTRFDSFDIKFTIESIHVLGGLAVEKGRHEGTVDPKDGPPRQQSGIYLYVYERDENDQWKIHRMSW